MPTRTVTIGSRIGLHGRPAAILVKAATALPVPVMISKGGTPVDARSILAILTLGARNGDTVTLEADGPGADAALDTLAALLTSDLDTETQPSTKVT